MRTDPKFLLEQRSSIHHELDKANATVEEHRAAQAEVDANLRDLTHQARNGGLEVDSLNLAQINELVRFADGDPHKTTIGSSQGYTMLWIEE